MSEHPDLVLLIVGATRVAIWAIIAIVGYRQRRLLPFAFGVLGALTRAIFALKIAETDISQEMVAGASFLAIPMAVLILMFVLVTRPTLPAPQHRGLRGWYL